MKILRYAVLLSCLALAWTGAQAQNALGAKLVGTWREYAPTDNLVSFARDGAWKLYLKKGEIGNFKSLEGSWSISEQDGTLAIVLLLAGKEKPMPPVRLSFEGEEMVLTDAAGKQTRHRRHEGPIPEQYRW